MHEANTGCSVLQEIHTLPWLYLMPIKARPHLELFNQKKLEKVN